MAEGVPDPLSVGEGDADWLGVMELVGEQPSFRAEMSTLGKKPRSEKGAPTDGDVTAATGTAKPRVGSPP